MCWKLRCSLLHSGDYDVSVDAPEKDESFDYDYKFELVLHGCNAAEACLKETGETVSYPNLELFDVAAWADRFNTC